MNILVSKQKSKVKSLTIDGEKAITRAYKYMYEGKDCVMINIVVLFFSESESESDVLLRKYKGKYVYLRESSFKVNTLINTLINLGIGNVI